MASKEHQQLAAYIKGVHLSLRLKSRALGPDEAWHQHCQDTDVLEKYARNMQLLATEFWEKNSCEESDLCRIQWVVKECDEYFYSEGQEKALRKEEKLSMQYLNTKLEINLLLNKEDSRLKLLDVGSCYNPFSKFHNFEVTAVDLMPATPDVIKCDFLSVHVSSEAIPIENPCTVLSERYFDVIVFSLLLEYLPSSKQRFKCCKTACELLSPSGLLIILTPDSKHATANSKVMKSWRFALASLGFWRISYQKQKHLHCMAYRKCFNPEVTRSWLIRQKSDSRPEDLFYIPQDFHNYCEDSDEGENQERSEVDNEIVANTFTNLPDFDIFT